MGRILLVDDERSLRQVLGMALKQDGHEIVESKDGVEAIHLLKEGGFDLVITDLKLPGADGLEVLKTSRKFMPAVQVILITAYATTENAIEAMKAGAYDYIVKPFKVDKFRVIVEKALEKTKLISENMRLKQSLGERFRLEDIIGKSAAIRQLYETVRKAAPTKASVLVMGESGTGKELVARAIHGLSPRVDKPFTVVNCSAIPETLMESELFGHKKGSFTGAHEDKKGLFEAADGGTVFLDEVAEIPPGLQVKLLRVLQDHSFKPVGSVIEMTTDVRIVAATNRDLGNEVERGRFREDLFYRLNVVHITLPPLRRRRADIPLLAEHFLKKFSVEQGKEIAGFSKEAMETLCSASDYKGNVRQLANIIERAVIFTDSGTIGLEVIADREDRLDKERENEVWDPGKKTIDLEEELSKLEAKLLMEALERAEGNQQMAASLLNIAAGSFRNRLKKLGLEG